MLIVIHNYSPASLDKQLQTSGLFPNRSSLFPTPGLVVASAFLPNGWLKVQRGKMKDGKQRRNRELQLIFFFLHAATLVLMHMWMFAGKMGIP